MMNHYTKFMVNLKFIFILLILTFISCKNGVKSDVMDNQEPTFQIVTPKGSEKPAVFVGNHGFKNERAGDLTTDGINFIKDGQYLNAEKKFKEALIYEYDNPVILTNLGNLAIDFGETLEGIDLYKQAIKFSDSTYFNALYNLGNTYCKIDRYQDSEEILNFI